MTDQPTIIRDNQTLFSCYHQLKENDIICGRIRLKPGEEHLLTDLLARGLRLIPSATSQLASRSKVFQAKLFSQFMLKGSLPIYDSHGLLGASSSYHQMGTKKVVLKNDRKNGGLGVHIFRDIEDLYNLVSSGAFPFPFVIQPYQEQHRDIRVIILGDYLEAYERTNPNNFRKNLHCGGESTLFSLSQKHLSFCRQVMKRGQFPYAHLDLMLTDDDNCWLTEINLRGGLKGAQISGREYQEKLDYLHEQLLKGILKNL